MQSKRFSWYGGLPLACALMASAAAQTGTALEGSAQAASAELAGFAQPLAMAELDNHRGGTQILHNDMTLAGTTADNTATQVNTGNNAISSGAFANMSGIPVVVQNSGANVLIQNALILHLQIN